MKFIINELQLRLLTEEKGVSKSDYPECVRNLGDIVKSKSGELSILVQKGDYKNFQFYYPGRVRYPNGEMKSYTCFDGQLVVGTTKQYMESCVRRTKNVSGDALGFWLDWVDSPEIANKYKKNNNVTELQRLTYYTDYLKWLKNFHIIHYYSETDGNGAFFMPGEEKTFPGRIHLNCSYLPNNEKLREEIIHEIQHALTAIHPLNPAWLIDSYTSQQDLFSNVNLQTDYHSEKSPSKVKSTTSNQITNYTFHQVKQVSETFGIDQDYATRLMSWWQQQCRDIIYSYGPGYDCEATEKNSNLESLRRKLFYNPKTRKVDFSKNITPAHIKPYFLGNKDDINVELLIRCWTRNGFNNFESFLANLNSLAKNQKNDLINSPNQSYNQFDKTS